MKVTKSTTRVTPKRVKSKSNSTSPKKLRPSKATTPRCLKQPANDTRLGWFKLPVAPSGNLTTALQKSPQRPSLSTSGVTLDSWMLSQSDTQEGEEQYELPCSMELASLPLGFPVKVVRGFTKGELTIETAPHSDDVHITFKGVDYFLTRDLFHALRVIDPIAKYDCGPVPGLHQAIFRLQYLRGIDADPVDSISPISDPRLIFRESALMTSHVGAFEQSLSSITTSREISPPPSPESPLDTRPFDLSDSIIPSLESHFEFDDTSLL